ncbi:hypothetical protein B296_00021116 [Ensete ventricosum]|uniref:Uncharacterized protein n=1 Tax=Ensete ventricosum TaxID=4639 RepID=A0A427A9R3_ENSVE|nr:hypothetical protein B296_00021116 [Ensete ventricosum]
MRCALREEFVLPLLFPLDHFSFMDTGEYECDDQMVTRALPQRQVNETVGHTILIEAFEHRWRRHKQSPRHVLQQTRHVEQCLLVQKHRSRRRL